MFAPRGKAPLKVAVNHFQVNTLLRLPLRFKYTKQLCYQHSTSKTVTFDNCPKDLERNMTERYLAQLEIQIDNLLSHCENLEQQNKLLQKSIANMQQSESAMSQDYQQLQLQHVELSEHLRILEAKEQRARVSEQNALHEKSKLVQLNDKTRNHIEKMITRLKALEQNA